MVLALLAILVLLGVIVLWNEFAGPEKTETEQSEVQDRAKPDAPNEQVREARLEAVVQKPAEKKPLSLSKRILDPAKQKGMLRLHDGMFIEPLNGAIDPPVAHWQAERPYSPIIGKEKSVWPDIGELEFYIHADGTKTTTMMNNVNRMGVYAIEPITIVIHPHPKGLKPKLFEGVEVDGEGDPKDRKNKATVKNGGKVSK